MFYGNKNSSSSFSLMPHDLCSGPLAITVMLMYIVFLCACLFVADAIPSKRHKSGLGDMEEDGFADQGVPFLSYRPTPDYAPWCDGILRSTAHALGC